MFIAYYWVENWLKLMAACAEQMQPLTAGGDARTAADAELTQLRDALANSQAALTAVAQERGELQAELERRQRQAEADRADHARQRTDNGSVAEKRLGEQAATRAAAQAEAEALRGKLMAASDDARQAQAEAARLREDGKAAQAKAKQAAEQAAEEAKGQSERLAKEIAALRRERQAAVAQADALRAENERLAGEIAAQKTTAESLRLELGAAQKKLQAALSDAAEARRAANSTRPPVEDAPPAEHRKTPKRARKPSATPANAASTAAEAVRPTLPEAVSPTTPEAVSPTTPEAVTQTTTKAANPAGLALRFRKPEDWAEPVHVHYWNTDPAVAEPVWPGTAMTDQGEGWWAFRIEGTRTASLVFNDAAGRQTGNLHRDRPGSLESDGAWADDA